MPQQGRLTNQPIVQQFIARLEPAFAEDDDNAASKVVEVTSS